MDAQAFSRYLRLRAQRPKIIVDDFDPSVIPPVDVTPSWVDVFGNVAEPPSYNLLPTPEDVLSGAAKPNFAGLRLRDPNNFRNGNLHHHAHDWDTLMSGDSWEEETRVRVFHPPRQARVPASTQHDVASNPVDNVQQTEEDSSV